MDIKCPPVPKVSLAATLTLKDGLSLDCDEPRLTVTGAEEQAVSVWTIVSRHLAPCFEHVRCLTVAIINAVIAIVVINLLIIYVIIVSLCAVGLLVNGAIAFLGVGFL